MDSSKEPTKTHEVGEDTKITIKIKDAVAIASFLVYVGISIAGYLFARNKLDDLSRGNDTLQEKVSRLEEEYKVNTEILKRVEGQVNIVTEYLIKNKK